MITTETAEPRVVLLALSLDEKFVDAAKFLIEARAMHGDFLGGQSLEDAVTAIAENAAANLRFDQILTMIDDPHISPHLHERFTKKRAAYATLLR